MSPRDQWLGEALGLHEAGRLAEAETLYRQLLERDADDADAQHLLGVLAHQTGRNDEAVRLIGRAIQSQPGNPVFHNNLSIVALAGGGVQAAIDHAEHALVLAPGYPEAFNNRGNALKAARRLDEAADSYRGALRLKPDYTEAWFNFGNVLHVQHKLDQAIEVYRHALSLRPDYLDALINLGSVLTDAGRPLEAIEQFERVLQAGIRDIRVLNNLGNAFKAVGDVARALDCYRQALALDPANEAVLNNFGNALQKTGDVDGAIAAYRQVLARRPGHGETLSNLGNALQMHGLIDEAMACYGEALAAEPDAPMTLHNLGMALRKRNRLIEAEAHLRRALAWRPDYVEALAGLGSILETQGRMGEAIELFGKALSLDPGFAEALAHLLFALSSHPGADPAHLRRVTEQGVAAWTRPPWSVPARRPSAGPRLRIGYVTADLRSHPVGHFLGGVLRHHDRAQIEIFCYWTGWVTDGVTERLRPFIEHWRDIAALDDEASARLIAEDGIDILIDLAGHTADHRLKLFMGRAAPIQASWLGFFGTTAVPAMDYLIADAIIVPPGDEGFYTEEIVRLPGCYISFDSLGADLPVRPAPVARNGHVTFGCFNRRDKITLQTIDVWSSILHAMPGSILLLKNGAMADVGVAAALRRQFLDHGITDDRLVLEGPAPRQTYLEDYGRIDIALDPFPFCGGTTTAETLWMGVPLVTLYGTTWAGRISASMLSACGHGEWIARDIEAYRRIAIDLAQGPTRLQDLRPALREAATRHLCDAAGFTRELEACLSRMVRKSDAAGA